MAGKYKIVSNGTTHDTKIIDPEGNVVGMVSSLKLNLNANEKFISAEMGILDVELDIEVPDDRVIVHKLCPQCLEAKKEAEAS